MRSTLPKSRLSKIAYADDGTQAHNESTSTLPSSEHGHAPPAPDLPRPPRHALSKHESLPRQRRREAQPPGRSASLPPPATPDLLSLMQAISDDPHGGAEPAAFIERLALATPPDETTAPPKTDISRMLQEIQEKDPIRGAKLAALVKGENAPLAERTSPQLNSDIIQMLYEIRKKDPKQGAKLAAFIEGNNLMQTGGETSQPPERGPSA